MWLDNEAISILRKIILDSHNSNSFLTFVVQRTFFIANPSLPILGSSNLDHFLHGGTPEKDFVGKISKESFDGVKKWKIKRENPPLSAKQALIAANEYYNSITKNGEFPEGADIRTIELTAFDPEVGDWYWKIEYQLLSAGGEGSFIEIGVLMNGSVIPLSGSNRK